MGLGSERKTEHEEVNRKMRHLKTEQDEELRREEMTFFLQKNREIQSKGIKKRKQKKEGFSGFPGAEAEHSGLPGANQRAYLTNL